MTEEPLLDLKNITKSYPGVKANEDISFEVRKGEIHALLGENGAGKSTLVKMIYGLVKPDLGIMNLEGEDFRPTEPRIARLSGIAMVFQHFSLFEALTVAENIALGMENPPNSNILSDQIGKISSKYGLSLDPKRVIGDLSVGERQRVEIIRCLLQEPKLLIMDEPTSVLTPQEVQALFLTLRRLRDEGTSILYISHKLEEIKVLCERATILRHGRVIGTCIPKFETAKSMAEMMVGSKLKSLKRSARHLGEPILEVNDLSLKSLDPFGTSLKNVTFNLRAGEVLGVAGVAGNGQDELIAVLSGEILSEKNAIKLEGKYIGEYDPVERRLHGLLTAPEERLGHAAAPDMSLAENTLITGYQRQNLGHRGFLNKSAAIVFAKKIVKQFDVRTPSVRNGVKSLSGGNLQKFVIGREVLQNPKVFVVNQPTWGVDAAAAAFIRQALLELAQDGASILVISQDLDELMEISDSIMVLSEGHISTPRPADGITTEAIGLMMGGTEL